MQNPQGMPDKKAALLYVHFLVRAYLGFCWPSLCVISDVQTSVYLFRVVYLVWSLMSVLLLHGRGSWDLSNLPSVPVFICVVIRMSLKVICTQFDMYLALESSPSDRRLMGPDPRVRNSALNPTSDLLWSQFPLGIPPSFLAGHPRFPFGSFSLLFLLFACLVVHCCPPSIILL